MSCPITQPMLAGKCSAMEKLKFPCLASPKLDGVRCLKINGQILSRKWKPIPNHYVRGLLERILTDGMDGELMAVNEDGSLCTFNQVQSAVMTEEGEPRVEFWAFDRVNDSLIDPPPLLEPYASRLKALIRFTSHMSEDVQKVLKVVDTVLIHNVAELEEYEEQCLAQGFEGVMVRDPQGPYKLGRSTEREGTLLKIKRFTDFEAEVVGLVEQMHNANEAEKDAFGRTKRSSHKANKVGKNTLGALMLKTKDGIEFECGTGFDDATRKEIWGNQSKYMGKFAKVKSQAFGQKDKPRFPVFLGFRDERDMD